MDVLLECSGCAREALLPLAALTYGLSIPMSSAACTGPIGSEEVTLRAYQLVVVDRPHDGYICTVERLENRGRDVAMNVLNVRDIGLGLIDELST
jgi:hypothetical protein